jgi:hypothetical protein
MNCGPPAGCGAAERLPFTFGCEPAAVNEGVENGRFAEYGELRIHLRVLPAQKNNPGLAETGRRSGMRRLELDF